MTPTSLHKAHLMFDDTSPSTGKLFGRQNELLHMLRAWENHSESVLVVSGCGGIGKSRLALEFMNLVVKSEPSAKCFAWSFLGQGQQERLVESADFFASELLEFLGNHVDAHETPWERGQRIASLMRKDRVLLILDGIEPFQDEQTGSLREPILQALVSEMSQQEKNLCLVTTRVPGFNLEGCMNHRVGRISLGALGVSYGATLLQEKGVPGEESDLMMMAFACHGHALTLRLLGGLLGSPTREKKKRCWETFLSLSCSSANPEPLLGVHSVLRAFDDSFGRSPESALLRLAALFETPVAIENLRDIIKMPPIDELTKPLLDLSELGWNTLLSRLENHSLISLVTQNRLIWLHPIVREYFRGVLREEHLPVMRVAHGRIFEYLRRKTERRPNVLQPMRPLYQALQHGYQAGLADTAFVDIFWTRIRRGHVDYSSRELGAITSDAIALREYLRYRRANLADGDIGALRAALSQAITKFCEIGWSDEALQAASLRFEMARSQGITEAAVAASEIAELQLLFGKLQNARGMATLALMLAERASDVHLRIKHQARLARILYCQGELSLAMETFLAAEALNSEGANEHSMLQDLEGLLFCEFLIEMGRLEEFRVRLAKIISQQNEDTPSEEIDFAQRVKARFLHRLGDTREAVACINQLLNSSSSKNKQIRASALFVKAAVIFEAAPNQALVDLEEALSNAAHLSLRLLWCDVQLLRARILLERHVDTARIVLRDVRSAIEASDYLVKMPELLILEARLALLEKREKEFQKLAQHAMRLVEDSGYQACENEMRRLVDVSCSYPEQLDIQRSPIQVQSHALRFPLTILHLTDLHFADRLEQFSGSHCWEAKGCSILNAPESNRQGLLESIIWDLKNNRWAPDLVVISGILLDPQQERGVALAIDSLKSLSEQLHLGRERFVLVPGGHDLRDTSITDGYYSCFSRLWTDFYGESRPMIAGSPTHEQVDLFDLRRQLGVQIIGFSSYEKYNKGLFTGCAVSAHQLAQAERLLGQSGEALFRIAVIHHHLYSPKNNRKDMGLAGWSPDFQDWLRKYQFQIVLYGCQHVGWNEKDSSNDWLSPAVLRASVVVGHYRHQRRNVRLGYQVIRIEDETHGWLFRRSYDPINLSFVAAPHSEREALRFGAWQAQIED